MRCRCVLRVNEPCACQPRSGGVSFCRMSSLRQKWYLLCFLKEADMATGNCRRVEISGDEASGRDSQGSSLVPMLIAGIILVTLGAVVIMMFV